MDKNLYAYTAPGSEMPPHISVNRVGEGCTVTVRSTGGAVATIGLSRGQVEDLAVSLQAEVTEN